MDLAYRRHPHRRRSQLRQPQRYDDEHFNPKFVRTNSGILLHTTWLRSSNTSLRCFTASTNKFLGYLPTIQQGREFQTTLEIPAIEKFFASKTHLCQPRPSTLTVRQISNDIVEENLISRNCIEAENLKLKS